MPTGEHKRPIWPKSQRGAEEDIAKFVEAVDVALKDHYLQNMSVIIF